MTTAAAAGTPTAPQPIIPPPSQDRSILPPPASPGPATAASPPSKRELASWWKKFRKQEKAEEKVEPPPAIFGVPLTESIRYANVAISLTNDQGESFIYGYVPIVVAKCGVFLKEKATDVEGIFRLSGSAKRIKDLQTIFNSPDRYGKGLDWTGYTVHDAANIFRRYLNQLPEPIVPLDFYERFREPLQSFQTRPMENGEMLPIDMSVEQHGNAVVAYQKLITELPPLNRQLLLYILDLLAVFASKSDLNRMTAANLAAIFQPGIISHPNHDMTPTEYRLSQDVLIFLIENQDHFLIGMSGTGMDEQTRAEVESGVPVSHTPKPGGGRSSSNASAGADSLRKYGVRRNVSTSSHHSRDRPSPGVTSPGTPTGSFHQGQGSCILTRSNTVPSKRSPAIGAARFQGLADNSPAPSSIQHSPEPGRDLDSARQPSQNQYAASPSPRLAANPAAVNSAAPNSAPTTKTAGGDLLNDTTTAAAITATAAAAATTAAATATSAATTSTGGNIASASANASGGSNGNTTTASPPSRERKISSIFSRSPIFSPSDPSKPQRKLQKRRGLPGSSNESAENSQSSLHGDDGANLSTPLISPSLISASQGDPLANAGLLATPNNSKNAKSGDRAGLQPPRSPALSTQSRSSVTDHSEFDQLDTLGPSSAPANVNQGAGGEKKKTRWRFSASAKQRPDDFPLQPPPLIGVNPGAQGSNSSIGSSGLGRSDGARPRMSFTNDSRATSATSHTFQDNASSQKGAISDLPIGLPSNRNSNEVSKERDREAGVSTEAVAAAAAAAATATAAAAATTTTTTTASSGAAGEEKKGGLFGKWKAKMSEQREKKEQAKSPPPAFASYQGYPGKYASTADGSGSEDGRSRSSLSAFAQEHFSSNPIRRSLDKQGHSRGCSSGPPPVSEKTASSGGGAATATTSANATPAAASEQASIPKAELETVKERPLSEATLRATPKEPATPQQQSTTESSTATTATATTDESQEKQDIATGLGILPSLAEKENEAASAGAETASANPDKAAEEKKN